MVRDGYKQTEIGIVPKDWDVKKLGVLSNVEMCKRIFSYQTKLMGEIPFYKIGTFAKTVADAYISRSIFEEYKRKYPYPKVGDVLLSAAGTLGRTFVYKGQEAYYQDSNIVWLNINKALLHNSFLAQYYNVIKWAASEGSTIARLYNGIIENTSIPIPSLAEQERIAEALSDVDSLIVSLEALIEKKRAIKQGAMQNLLTGKTRLSGFVGGWKKCKLGDVGDILGGGTPSTSVRDYWGGDIAWCTPTDITSTNGKYIIKTVNTITSAGLMHSAAKLLPEKSLLLCTRATVGDMKICKTKMTTNQGFKNIIPNQEFNVEYLYYLLQTKKKVMQSLATGSTFLELSKTALCNILVECPSFTEQEQIAKVLSDMDEEIETLERKLAKARNLKQGMMQQLLTGTIRLV